MRRCLLACILLLNLSLAFAQQVTISGTVTGSDNAPVEGVSVKVKGSQTAGAITDAEGKYRITIPSRSAVLIFSHVGYVERELSPGTNSTFDVVLQSRIKESEEVVVVGYGTVRKKDLTGSVAKVNMEDINKAPLEYLNLAAGLCEAALDIFNYDKFEIESIFESHFFKFHILCKNSYFLLDGNFTFPGIIQGHPDQLRKHLQIFFCQVVLIIYQEALNGIQRVEYEMWVHLGQQSFLHSGFFCFKAGKNGAVFKHHSVSINLLQTRTGLQQHQQANASKPAQYNPSLIKQPLSFR